VTAGDASCPRRSESDRYWSRLLDWKNQTLTPNPDAIYLMPFIDTADGPVVLETIKRSRRLSRAPRDERSTESIEKRLEYRKPLILGVGFCYRCY